MLEFKPLFEAHVAYAEDKAMAVNDTRGRRPDDPTIAQLFTVFGLVGD